MQETTAERASSSAGDEPGVSWAHYLDVLLRWKRFVLGGIAAAWTAILLLVLVLPRTYECEATLSLPNTRGRPDPEPIVGIPLSIFKKLEKTLSDEAVLSSALSGKLSKSEIQQIQRNIGRFIAPLTTTTRNEIQRMTTADAVSGLRLLYEASPEKAQEIVLALADLVREAVLTNLLREQVDSELLRATLNQSAMHKRKMDLLHTNGSLQRQVADIERLVARFPGSSSIREVVDTKEGGYRYLPPTSQIVGIKANQAENEHQTRVADRTLHLETLRIEYWRRLETRLAAESKTVVVSDVPRIVRQEGEKLFADGSASDPDVPYLKTEIEALADALAIHRASTRLIQYPTSRAKSRLPLVLTAAALSALFFVVAAYMAESWRRFRSEREAV